MATIEVGKKQPAWRVQMANRILIILVVIASITATSLAAQSAGLNWDPPSRINPYWREKTVSYIPLSIKAYKDSVQSQVTTTYIPSIVSEFLSVVIYRTFSIANNDITSFIKSESGATLVAQKIDDQFTLDMNFQELADITLEAEDLDNLSVAQSRRLKDILTGTMLSFEFFLLELAKDAVDSVYPKYSPQHLLGRQIILAIAAASAAKGALNEAITMWIDNAKLFVEFTNDILDTLDNTKTLNAAWLLTEESEAITNIFSRPSPQSTKQMAIYRLHYIFMSFDGVSFKALPDQDGQTWGQSVEALLKKYYNKYKFTDTQDDTTWFFPYVHFLHQDGLISGYPDGSFKPGNDVNRAEFLKMVVEALQRLSPQPLTPGPLPDGVATDQWYSEYLAIAYNYKNPRNNNEAIAFWETPPNFSVGVTRDEASRILVNALRYSLDSSDPVRELVDVTATASPWIYKLYEKLAVTGYADGSFRPNQILTRAEAAKLIYMLLLYNGYAPLAGETIETL